MCIFCDLGTCVDPRHRKDVARNCEFCKRGICATHVDLGQIRYKYHRDVVQSATLAVFPVWNVLMFPERYPSYGGDLKGFDSTALPKVYNPIIAASGKKGYELLYSDFIDGEKVERERPASDGYIYREFHTHHERIIAFVDLEPGGFPSWNDIRAHWTLGYLGVRKVSPENEEMMKLFAREYGIREADTKPGSKKHGYFYSAYRFLDVEEQGLSTNLSENSAHFMDGCRMHRLSLSAFLTRFPFGEDSPLLADWDFGHCQDVGPARDRGHVDIKLNPLWLAKEKPWKKSYMLGIDGNFYRDLLNRLLAENRDLWRPVR